MTLTDRQARELDRAKRHLVKAERAFSRAALALAPRVPTSHAHRALAAFAAARHAVLSAYDHLLFGHEHLEREYIE